LHPPFTALVWRFPHRCVLDGPSIEHPPFTALVWRFPHRCVLDGPSIEPGGVRRKNHSMHAATGGGAKTSDTAVIVSSSAFVEFFEHCVFGRSVQTYRHDDAETEELIVDF